MTALLTRPDLLRALAGVSVSPDRCSATVAGAALTAESPRQLTAELGAALYGFLHSGQGAVPPSFVQRRRDLPFEEELRAGLPHRRRGDLLRLQLPAGRPALSPGFFLVEGSRQPSRRSELLRVYVHLDAAEHAPAVWAAVLSHLEDRALPYQAKVLSDRALYPRRDALVVYLPRESWSGLAPLAAALADSAGIGPATCLLAHPGRAGCRDRRRAVGPTPPGHVPELGLHRLLLVVTGSATASEVPLLVSWLTRAHPDLDLTIVLTRSARRFVTPGAPAGQSRSDVVLDEWPDPSWESASSCRMQRG